MAGRKKKSASASGKSSSARKKKQPGKTTPVNVDQDISSTVNHAETVSRLANITLSTVITLAEVSQLRELLLGHMSTPEIQVDVSKIEHIDTAGLQLLLAFSKTIAKQGGKLSWTGWSPAYAGTAELLGLTATAGVKEN